METNNYNRGGGGGRSGGRGSGGGGSYNQQYQQDQQYSQTHTGGGGGGRGSRGGGGRGDRPVQGYGGPQQPLMGQDSGGGRGYQPVQRYSGPKPAIFAGASGLAVQIDRPLPGMHFFTGASGLAVQIYLSLPAVQTVLPLPVLPFRKPMPVIDFLMENVPDFREVNDVNRLRREVERALIGLQVTVKHRTTNQKFVLMGFTRKVTRDHSFTCVDREGKVPSKELKVVDYFEQKYQKTIEYKDIPCLELGERRDAVPMEFCVIVDGQKPKEKLDGRAAKFLRVISVVPPAERKMIKNFINVDNGMKFKTTGSQYKDIPYFFFMSLFIPQSRLDQLVGAPVQPMHTVPIATSENPEDDLESSRDSIRTLDQILRTREIGNYWVFCKVVTVENIYEWYYIACEHCYKKLTPAGGIFYCDYCDTFERNGVPRYRVQVRVVDDYGNSSFTLLDKECCKLIGKTANELAAATTGDDVPVEIAMMVGLEAFFKIQVRGVIIGFNLGPHPVLKMTSDRHMIGKYCPTADSDPDVKGKGKSPMELKPVLVNGTLDEGESELLSFLTPRRISKSESTVQLQ